MRARWHRVILGGALAFVAACGSDAPSGGEPRPPHDAGSAEDGAAPVDAADATSPQEDTGQGPAGDDAGDSAEGGEAGRAEGGPVVAPGPIVPCTDALSDVYVTPSGLPPMAPGARGNIVRCAYDSTLSVADVQAAFASKSVSGVPVTTGIDLFRVAYRTYRDDGVPGVSTARVYLPHVPRSRPMPVVAVAHPTEGLAKGCAPSADSTSLEDEALPWAAAGFAVIASDYAGLGNEGVQGYLDNHDQAHSVLDSARALRTLLDPAVLDARVLLVGYSQGGGAVLASQGLARAYGAGGDLIAVVVFAAEYFARMNSVQFVTTLASPNVLTISTGVTVPVVTATRDYAYAYNVLGSDAGGVPFPGGAAAGIQAALMSLCQVPFGGYIQGVATHLGDLFDDAFRTSLLACIQGDAGCSGAGAQYYQWLQGDLVPPDPSGAPILYVQGLSDTIMPPAQEAACNVGQLQDAGVDLQVCTDQAALHTDVVARNVAFALQWSLAVIDGGARPSCSSDGMPSCQP